jgi:hypothetical protein
MTNIASDETKKIPAKRWADWSATFTNGNRGRVLKVVNETATTTLTVN